MSFPTFGEGGYEFINVLLDRRVKKWKVSDSKITTTEERIECYYKFYKLSSQFIVSDIQKNF